jgi:hypothetical protein
MPLTTLPDRLRLIVDVLFGGNAALAATTAELTPPAFHRLLTGTVSNPRLSTASRLASSFGLPVEYLMGLPVPGGLGDLPEEFWLLRSFHRARQEPIREALAKISDGLRTAEKRRNAELKRISELSRLSIVPVEPRSELEGAVGRLFEGAGRPTSGGIALLRHYYEVETETLALALKSLRMPFKREVEG